jgi:beta-galactosidase/beta-glucuronidase
MGKGILIAGQIESRWVGDAEQEIPLSEYPRPQFVRPDWLCLNGLWDYTVTTISEEHPAEYKGKIRVPYALETALSGVGEQLNPDEQIWYRTTFELQENWDNGRIHLNFEAVDWSCRIFVNGTEAGNHTGGYTPFTFDITSLLTFNKKDSQQEIIVSVTDPTDTLWQLRGKQVLNPGGINYTATSGIWQTVWLEHVQEAYLTDLRVVPDLNTGEVEITAVISDGDKIRFSIKDGKKIVKRATGKSGVPIKMQVPYMRAWTPEFPVLYDLIIETIDGKTVTDRVISYFAMRKVSVSRDRNEVQRIYLNNLPIFLNGPLDQGYWPESGMTPPADDAMIYDLEMIKRLGFNMVRKHVQIAPRRWYYHCDRLGIAVIQDMVSGGRDLSSKLDIMRAVVFGKHKKDTSVKARIKSWRDSEESRNGFEHGLREIIYNLFNVPSILIWVVFNEGWGQYNAAETANWVKAYDPSRLVDHASGWHDQKGGDFVSLHTYKIRLKHPPIHDERVYIISEYGGYSFQESLHTWKNSGGKPFGYKQFSDREKLQEAYTALLTEQVQPLVRKGLSAVVYTQLSDIEEEINGLMTYDRKVLKFDEQKMQLLNQSLQDEFFKSV